MSYDPDRLNRDLRQVRNRFEEERRYQQRIDNVDRIAEGLRGRRETAGGAQGAVTSPVVWFFGLIGALMGVAIRPFGMDGFFGAVFGFIVAGMAAGYLSESEKGRVVLWIAGLGVVGLGVVAVLLA